MRKNAERLFGTVLVAATALGLLGSACGGGDDAGDSKPGAGSDDAIIVQA